FTQYESQRTGLRVTVVDRKGPKVYGYFAVATEIHDDSGSRKCTHLISRTPLMKLSAHSGTSHLHGRAQIPLQGFTGQIIHSLLLRHQCLD
ncbi:hypothetical protein CPI04_07100, partial [Moraxella catarrhalis]|nr:hypothetical protein [Moraxella catarrhalis]